MIKPKIILLSGKQGSGKSTVQKALAEEIFKTAKAHKPIMKNFADPIYQMHDFCRGVLKDNNIHVSEKKDGVLLQTLGTEWGRNTTGENVWVDVMKGAIENESKLCGAGIIPAFIISDCRFKNEFDGFPEALRIRLRCDEEIRKKRCSSWRENTQHPSEIDLDIYEERGFFDKVFDSGFLPVGHIVHFIFEELMKGDWHLGRETK